MNIDWDVLNKIAIITTIITTIINLPATIWGIYNLICIKKNLYDMYKERNSAGGDTIFIDNCSKRDCRKGKKENPSRQYHKKERDINDENNWV